MSDTARALRPCAACDVVDDGPRHVFGGSAGVLSLRHPACCAAGGCDICADSLKGI